jgi:hypothetical protein
MSGLTAATPAVWALRLRRLPLDPAALAAWAAPFVVVLYLALHNGGYDVVLRSQVGIAAWWIVLLGAVVGVLPAVRLGAAAWAGLALLTGFVAWTALSLGWTESHERTAVELGKVAAYLGLFALALAAQGRVAMRHAINGVAAAIAVVGLLAVLYRLHPTWFSATDTDRFFPQNRRRLNYPLGYWNALAALMAVGLPLVLQAAGTARLLATRALAAAAIPVMALCAFLTVSRGGLGMVAVGVFVYLALSPERLFRIATALAAGAGAAILMLAADRRSGVTDALTGAAARHQSDQVLRLVVLVCAGVALVQVAIALVERHAGPPAWAVVPRRRAGVPAGGALAVAVAVFLVAGGPGWASDQWNQFRSASSSPAAEQSTAFSRLHNVSSNGRYQYWQLAAKARDGAPLKGTGSGTFEFLWSRDGTVGSGFVRDAHSLWMETQGELGWIGFLLIAGFFALVLATGAVRALREPDPHRRLVLAAATAGVAAFAAAAAVEWVWEMAVLPAIVLLLAAVLLSGGSPRWVRLASVARERRGLSRLALALVALPAVVAIAIPLATTTAVRDSQAAVRDGQLADGLEAARTAAAIEPSASTPDLQQALIFERAGALDKAAAYARNATRAEPTNWRPWLTLSRIEAERGRARTSVAALRRARELDRRSPMFARTP